MTNKFSIRVSRAKSVEIATAGRNEGSIRARGRSKYAFKSADFYAEQIKDALAATAQMVKAQGGVSIARVTSTTPLTISMNAMPQGEPSTSSTTAPAPAPAQPVQIPAAVATHCLAVSDGEAGLVDAMTGAIALQNANGMVESLIDPLREAFEWAIKPGNKKSAKKFGLIKKQMMSLRWHVNKLEALNHAIQDRKDIWDVAVGFFGKMLPPIKMREIIQALFEQCFQDLLYTLARFADYVRQERSGKFAKSTAAIELFCAEMARQTLENLDAYSARTGKVIPEKNLPFVRGNFWAALVNFESLATSPADPKGPLGLELILPSRSVVGPNGKEKTGSLMGAFPAFAHEDFHDFVADVPFLPEKRRQVAQTVLALYKAGKLKLTQDKVTIGDDPKTAITVPTIAILLSMFTQESVLNELSSDKFMLLRHGIGGYVSLQRYFKSIVNYELQRSTFDRNDFPNDSSYKLDMEELAKGNLAMEVEEHEPMGERLLADSFVFDIDKRPELGDFSRNSLIEQNGGAIPEFVVLYGEQGSCRIATADVLAVELIATQVVMYAPIESLGGACLRDIIDWTPDVEPLVEETVNMIASDAKLVLPKYKYPTRIIASACARAGNVLVHKFQMWPKDAHELVEERGLELMMMAVAANEVRTRKELRQARRSKKAKSAKKA